MLRRLAATPCPIGSDQDFLNRRDSVCANGDDSTANIDFTTVYKASFRNVKPRRPPGKPKKAVGHELGFTIHEDQELQIDNEPKPQVKDYTGISQARRAATISRAPQRPSRGVGFIQDEVPKEPSSAKSSHPSGLDKAPRRASLQIAAHSDMRHGYVDDTLPAVPSPRIARPARRGTVYIPNDDTTMPSMYMDIFSPLKGQPPDPSSSQEGVVQEHTGLAAQIYKKNATSRSQSLLVTSPKRGPLHASTRPLQVATMMEDRIGNGSWERESATRLLSLQERSDEEEAEEIDLRYQHPTSG